METRPKPNPPRISEHSLYKNRLQEYTQRSSIPLPIYHTINEGSPHAPRFRSTVMVDGASYTSANTYSQRKEAEQDVARLALGSIESKFKDQGCPLIHEDTIFCKSIMNEFAVKMKRPKPAYTTTLSEGIIPIFTSTVVFDDRVYTGTPGRNKKEAEQLAARSAIQSLLAYSSATTTLSEIIKSKTKLYAALHKVKDCGSVQEVDMRPQITPMDRNNEITGAARQLGNDQESNPCIQKLKKPKQEVLCETNNGPIGNVVAIVDHPVAGGSAIQKSNSCSTPIVTNLVAQNQMSTRAPMVPPSVVNSNPGHIAGVAAVKEVLKKNKKRKQQKIIYDERIQMAAAAVAADHSPRVQMAAAAVAADHSPRVQMAAAPVDRAQCCTCSGKL